MAFSNSILETLPLTVYVSVCDVEKSFMFDTTVDITGHVHFQFVGKHIIVNTARVVFPDVWALERFQTAKVSFKVTQGQWHWCHLLGHI